MIFSILGYRFRKYVSRNRNSSPFLSSDAFKDICGLSYEGMTNSSEVLSHRYGNRNIPIIFVKTDGAKEFSRCVIESDIQIDTVVYGDSDLDLNIDYIPFAHIRGKAYVQNLNIQHPRLEPLPIGIENLSRFYNGRPELFGEKYVRKTKFNSVLVGPFAPTHPDRVELEKLENSNYIKVVQDRLVPDVYAEFSSGFRFIACPRGNGFDTHRFWEALYRGSIPIVSESVWATHFQSLGIPLLTVKTWGQESIQNALLSSPFNEFDPRDIVSLWMEYWNTKFRYFKESSQNII